MSFVGRKTPYTVQQMMSAQRFDFGRIIRTLNLIAHVELTLALRGPTATAQQLDSRDALRRELAAVMNHLKDLRLDKSMYHLAHMIIAMGNDQAPWTFHDLAPHIAAFRSALVDELQGQSFVRAGPQRVPNVNGS